MFNAFVVGFRFLGISEFLPAVPLGIAFKPEFSPNRQLDITIGHVALLRQAVRHYSSDPTVEEVEHPVMNAANRSSQLITAAARK
jgi:hypothetical protein